MNVAIIAAAGQGTRMAGARPKQFLELAGTPIIIHTLKAFERCDAIHEIITVLVPEEAEDFVSLTRKYGLTKTTAAVAGGATRAESVLRGLQAVNPGQTEIVAVHDAARPLVQTDEIQRTVEAAEREGAAVLVSAGVDTVKEVIDGVVVRTLERSQLRNALTPQCFSYELLLRAYSKVDVLDPSLTDESSLIERLGARIVTVEGSSRNIKITRPEDLVIAEAILKAVSGER
jgi:2-C-methyl-D-erythritol 4-phosphate cytidylyltransferase